MLSPEFFQEERENALQKAHCAKVASIISCVAIAVIAAAILTVAALVFGVIAGLPFVAVLLLVTAFLLVDHICMPLYFLSKAHEQKAAQFQDISDCYTQIKAWDKTALNAFAEENKIQQVDLALQQPLCWVALFQYFQQEFNQKSSLFFAKHAVQAGTDPIQLESLLQTWEIRIETDAFALKIYAACLLQILHNAQSQTLIKDIEFDTRSYAQRHFLQIRRNIDPYFTCSFNNKACTATLRETETLLIPDLRHRIFRNLEA